MTKLLRCLNKDVTDITEDDLFMYITNYKRYRNVSNVYLDNIRLVMSTFFTWMHDKGYIQKNPSRGLSRIKAPQKIKYAFTDEELEKIKRGCKNDRDLALVEFLYSTGVRVSELTNLNISDVNFIENNAVVFGKGGKERIVYLSKTASMYLKKYLNSRKDTNNSLFVGNRSPFNRLTKAGVESLLKRIGSKVNVEDIHPHKFRRTFATNMLKKGMPIEEVKILLGHSKLDTTMLYCCIATDNVKHDFNKYMCS